MSYATSSARHARYPKANLTMAPPPNASSALPTLGKAKADSSRAGFSLLLMVTRAGTGRQSLRRRGSTLADQRPTARRGSALARCSVAPPFCNVRHFRAKRVGIAWHPVTPILQKCRALAWHSACVQG